MKIEKLVKKAKNGDNDAFNRINIGIPRNII